MDIGCVHRQHRPVKVRNDLTLRSASKRIPEPGTKYVIAHLLHEIYLGLSDEVKEA